MIFETRCKTPAFKSGFTMPINHEIFFAITHDGCDSRFYVLICLSFKVDGELKNKVKMDYDF